MSDHDRPGGSGTDGGGGGPRPTEEPRPPALALRLAALVLPAEHREDLLGDLEERFAAISRERGRGLARWWYRKEALAFVLRVLLERARDGAERASGWAGRGSGAGGGPGTRARRDVGEGRLASWLRDARFAVRGAARRPAFTAVTVLTLAVGIGGTTAVFSVVDGVLLRPLPYPDPDRLVAVLDERDGEAWWTSVPAHVTAWRDGASTLSGVGWAQPGTRSFMAPGGTLLEEVRVQRVSAGLLDVLGVEPLIGRGFLEGEARPGAAPVTVLTHAFWTRLGGDQGLVGASIPLDGVPHTVLGVLPRRATADVLEAHDLLVPRYVTEEELRSRARMLRTVARLSPGASADDAREELVRIMTGLGRGDADEGWSVRLVPLREHLVGDARPALLILLGAVGFVLLVSCVNVANLLLARGSARSRELAIRTALGAGGGRIARLLLVEALALSVLGGLAGALIAVHGTDALIGMAPEALPRMDTVGVDGRVLLFALAVSTLTGLLVGSLPAWRSAARAAGRGLAGARGMAGSGGGARIRSALVAAEVAFVLVLLAGAGLMLRSFSHLRSVDPGFPLEDRVLLEMTPPPSAYPSTERVGELFDDLVRRVRSAPGVEGAGVVTHPPLIGDDWSSYHIVESDPPPSADATPIGGMEGVGPGYFEALGLPLVDGRTFHAGDGPGGSPVVIVDEAMVARHWPDRSPLGDRVRMSRSGPLAEWHRVVGVVGAARYDPGSAPRPRLYLPHHRIPASSVTRWVVVHAESGRLEEVIPRLRAEVRAALPGVPIASLRTLEEAASGSVSRARLQTFLLGVFGAVGLLLGAVGVYGVQSYTVSRSTRELGVRIALGAARVGLLRTVLSRAMAPVLVGVGVGLAASLWLGRFLTSLLYEVSPASPGVLSAVSFVLLVVATGAAVVPAVRAIRVDPVQALRAE